MKTRKTIVLVAVAIAIAIASCRKVSSVSVDRVTTCHSNADCASPAVCHFDVAGCNIEGRCGNDTKCDESTKFCTCANKTIDGCIPSLPYAHEGPCASSAPGESTRAPQPRCATQDCATGKIVDDGCIDDGKGGKVCSSCVNACPPK